MDLEGNVKADSDNVKADSESDEEVASAPMTFDFSKFPPEVLAQMLTQMMMINAKSEKQAPVKKAAKRFQGELSVLNDVRTKGYWTQDRLAFSSLSKLLSRTDSFNLEKDFQSFEKHFKLIITNLKLLSFFDMTENYPPVTINEAAEIASQYQFASSEIFDLDGDILYID